MAMLREASAPADVASVRELFLEYARAVEAPCCFPGFEREVAGLPLPYRFLFLAEDSGAPAGCVAVRVLHGGHAEMKRLYVRPAYRGRGMGRELAEAAIAAARAAGHERMLLDSLPSMHQALRLYRELGFREIAPYLAEPTPGARCFELELL
jgi:ribosomal protein S18 acetylase RimI-like enzyme